MPLTACKQYCLAAGATQGTSPTRKTLAAINKIKINEITIISYRNYFG